MNTSLMTEWKPTISDHQRLHTANRSKPRSIYDYVAPEFLHDGRSCWIVAGWGAVWGQCQRLVECEFFEVDTLKKEVIMAMKPVPVSPVTQLIIDGGYNDFREMGYRIDENTFCKMGRRIDETLRKAELLRQRMESNDKKYGLE